VAWDFAAAVGRKHIFSRSGFDSSHKEHRQLSPALFAAGAHLSRLSTSKAASVNVYAEAELHVAATEEDILLEEFVGAAQMRLPLGLLIHSC
jgi:hypothetical protein